MRNLELLYLVVAYGMASIMFYATRHKTFPTVSHIALDRRLTRSVFFWGLAVSAIIFGIMMFAWAVPNYHLGVPAQALIGFIIASQILTGLFPINDKGFRGAHTIFASSLGLGMFCLILMLANTATLSGFVRSVNWLLAGGMVVLLVTSVKVPRGEYLLHEKIFFAFWHLAIFVTVYFG